MSELKLQSNGTLVIEQGRTTGGRNDCKDGSGFTRIEISTMDEYQEFNIAVLDNLSCSDGHYSPLFINLEQLKHLRAWIDKQLES